MLVSKHRRHLPNSNGVRRREQTGPIPRVILSFFVRSHERALETAGNLEVESREVGPFCVREPTGARNASQVEAIFDDINYPAYLVTKLIFPERSY